MCYHTDYGRSALKGVGIDSDVNKAWRHKAKAWSLKAKASIFWPQAKAKA